MELLCETGSPFSHLKTGALLTETSKGTTRRHEWGILSLMGDVENAFVYKSFRSRREIGIVCGVPLSTPLKSDIDSAETVGYDRMSAAGISCRGYKIWVSRLAAKKTIRQWDFKSAYVPITESNFDLRVGWDVLPGNKAACYCLT